MRLRVLDRIGVRGGILALHDVTRRRCWRRPQQWLSHERGEHCAYRSNWKNVVDLYMLDLFNRYHVIDVWWTGNHRL